MVHVCGARGAVEGVPVAADESPAALDGVLLPVADAVAVPVAVAL